MAYQNVGTPRFYINVMEWLDLSGYYSTGLNNLFRTLPVDPVGNGLINTPNSLSLTAMTDNGFMALLGHDLETNDNYASIEEDGTAIVLSNVVNSAGGSADHLNPSDDGFSIATFSGSPNIDYFNLAWAESSYIGSVIIGTYYDMPHSPDLNLSMTREYGGIKTIETKGGASLSNTFYSKPPAWGSLGAWEIGGGTTTLSKSGRRVWDLSFSYLQDSDLFPDVGNLNNYETSEYSRSNTNTQFTNTLLDGDDFYSQVIHRTNGGQLPFIFQPDGGTSGNNNPDQFAIAKFDMSSFKFDQVANSVYNVKLKIREVW